MVLLTPKFVLVAGLASLTAFSLAPPAEAAAIAMRRSHQQHISDSSEGWSGSSFHQADHPVLPLPARLRSASSKQTQARSETHSKGSMKRQSPRDFFASQRRTLTPEDLPPLLTRRDPSHHRVHQPPTTPAQQSTHEESEAEPFVHINGVNSHATLGRRAPDPHPDPHHRHHHHGNHHDHHHGSKHADDVVVIEGDNDNVHIGRRSPLPDRRHHHHHDRHWRPSAGSHMSSEKEDSDLGRRSPDPRHDHHHHHHHDHHGHGHQKGHGADKVIIKGDDNNVSVHSRSRIVRHQPLNRISEHQEATAHGGHQPRVHARKYIPSHQLHHNSESTDRIEHSKPSHHPDQDPTGNERRSVLINSVEGEEKYLVPDDYQDQRVTVIEGDGVSKVLPKAKRGDPGIEGVPGSIDIMSQSAKSNDGQRIASLVLVEPDSAMSEFGNDTFILNASENNHTQLYMVALNTTNSGMQGEDVPVALKVPVFNPDSASMEGYCATYDPQPPAPAPLSAEPCFYDEPTGPHKSQVFAYTPSTSVIRPMWFSNETDGEDALLDDASSNSTVKPNAAVDPKTPLSDEITSVTNIADFGNSTAPPSSIASLDNSTGIDEQATRPGSGNDSVIPDAVDFAAKAQNVTLIFTPAAPVVPPGSRTSPGELSDLDDETPMSNTTGTDMGSSTTPLTSNASGRFNDTETGWTGTMADDGLTAGSMPLPHLESSETVSPAAGPTEPSVSSTDGKDLNVMVGVARDNDGPGGVREQERNMRAVSTAPYKWKFDRERS